MPDSLPAPVRSAIPRGFSRHFVLYMLSERPMTGKELMDEAATRTEGIWKPSPGLVYPLLGRLAGEGLVEEVEGGRFQLTGRGRAALRQYEAVQQMWQRQLVVLTKLGYAGRFVVQDLVDRIISWGTTLRAQFDQLSRAQRERYRSFLRRQLQRLEGSGSEA